MMSTEPPLPAAPPDEGHASPAPPALMAPLQWKSLHLLGGAREAYIEHQGALYRLRLTSLGKLILTK